MIRIKPVLLLVAAVWIAGCSYKKEMVETGPGSTNPPAVICDTVVSRYSVEVSQIISSKCLSCHASAVANSLGGGNKLDTYTNLKLYTNSDFLLNVILHTPGYNPMPKGGSKLSDCDIAKIRTWMRNGALNN